MAKVLDPTLGVDTARSSTGVVVVRLTGSLEVRTAPNARVALDTIIGENPAKLVIDLLGVTSIDSAGLVAVTAPAMRCRRASIDVRLLPPDSSEARKLVDRVRVLPMLNGSAR